MSPMKHFSRKKNLKPTSKFSQLQLTRLLIKNYLKLARCKITNYRKQVSISQQLYPSCIGYENLSKINYTQHHKNLRFV